MADGRWQVEGNRTVMLDPDLTLAIQESELLKVHGASTAGRNLRKTLRQLISRRSRVGCRIAAYPIDY